jgi:single-stranded-DNA-specific exonuclease
MASPVARRRAPTRWTEPPPIREAEAQALATALGLPQPLAALLAARGHGEERAAKQFLRPQLDQLLDPLALPDMDVAAARLSRAIDAGETMVVHGDYDVDGMCSTALMTRALRALGAKVVPFIPDRRTDGYDLTDAGVDAAIAAGATLVLTCDCGTSAMAAAKRLQLEGVDLIISDHHLPGGPLPPAVAVLNPQRTDKPYAEVGRDLAAVGVAFKLALQVTRLRGGNENVVLNMLDLVAMATVADVARLRGENRVMVRRGLALLADSKSAGLRALIRSSGLEGKEITAGRVGFILAPRLNALGRLSKAIRGVELLLAESDAEANGLARQCEELNRERQEMDRTLLESALRTVDAMDLDATWAVTLSGEGWHPGVIGIVASRVVEQTARPVFLIAVHDGIGKGSGRSIGAFDLHAALVACDDLLIKHGGHRAAAGLTIDAAQIPAFAERFNAVARERLRADDLVRELKLDLELPLDAATPELERMLRHFEPFGMGNPGPMFVARGVRVVAGATKIGTDGVKAQMAGPAGPIEAVGWGMAERARELATGTVLDIAYKLERNEFRGVSKLQLGLADFRPAR